MTQAAARVEIVTAVEAAKAAWTAYPLEVEYENRNTVNLATVVNPYVGVDIVFYDAKQADLGPEPLQGVYGHVFFAVCTQEGRGTSQVTALSDHMGKALSRKAFPLVKTGVPKPQPAVTRKGWYCQVTLVSFWYHELA